MTTQKMNSDAMYELTIPHPRKVDGEERPSKPPLRFGTPRPKPLGHPSPPWHQSLTARNMTIAAGAGK